MDKSCPFDTGGRYEPPTRALHSSSSLIADRHFKALPHSTVIGGRLPAARDALLAAGSEARSVRCLRSKPCSFGQAAEEITTACQARCCRRRRFRRRTGMARLYRGIQRRDGIPEISHRRALEASSSRRNDYVAMRMSSRGTMPSHRPRVADPLSST